MSDGLATFESYRGMFFLVDGRCVPEDASVSVESTTVDIPIPFKEEPSLNLLPSNAIFHELLRCGIQLYI